VEGLGTGYYIEPKGKKEKRSFPSVREREEGLFKTTSYHFSSYLSDSLHRRRRVLITYIPYTLLIDI